MLVEETVEGRDEDETGRGFDFAGELSDCVPLLLEKRDAGHVLDTLERLGVLEELVSRGGLQVELGGEDEIEVFHRDPLHG